MKFTISKIIFFMISCEQKLRYWNLVSCGIESSVYTRSSLLNASIRKRPKNLTSFEKRS